MAVYEHCLRLRPEDPNALNGLGNAREALKRYDEALAAYDQALLASPGDPAILHNKGIVLWRLKRHEDALATFGKSLAIRPDHPSTLADRGELLTVMGRLDEAGADLSRALALATAQGSGDGPEIRTQLAVLLAASMASTDLENTALTSLSQSLSRALAELDEERRSALLLRTLRAGVSIRGLERVLATVAGLADDQANALVQRFRTAIRVLVTGDRALLEGLDSEVREAIESRLASGRSAGR